MILSSRHEARDARRVVESVLDAAGRPWSLRLSRWIDLLILIEEDAG
jgi:hypothetical protein